MSKYTLHMIAVGIVIFSALHYFLMAAGFNLAEYLSLWFFRTFRRHVSIHTGIYILFGLCAVYLAVQRDTWLPFLGETVMPSALVPLKPNSGNTEISVNVSPNAKVVYWSAKPGTEKSEQKNTPWVEDAYADYSNSGVTQANVDGVAKLSFDKGTDYVVPGGKTIKSHVHYREMDLQYGMMGPVQTIYV